MAYNDWQHKGTGNLQPPVQISAIIGNKVIIPHYHITDLAVITKLNLELCGIEVLAF
jgi:hypothetical protein